MYIMCVCLFSALSHRVGALQMSIIIIIIMLHNYAFFLSAVFRYCFIVSANVTAMLAQY